MKPQKYYRKPTDECSYIEKEIIEIFNLPLEVCLIREYVTTSKDIDGNVNSQAYCHIGYTNGDNTQCSLEIQKSVFVLIYSQKKEE